MSRRNLTHMNRRNFIALSAALSVNLVSCTSSNRIDCDVLVIGAGLAGLNAASLIEEQGFSVQVVEASDRVGGRLRTARIDEYSVELGGSEIGPLYGRIRDKCSKLNVDLHENRPKSTPFVLNVRGKNIMPDDWENAPQNLTLGREREIAPYLLQNRLFFDWLPFDDPTIWLDPKYHEHDISCAEFMRRRGVSEEAIRLSNIDVNGPSMEQMSAMTIFRDLARLKMEGFRDPTKPQYGGENTNKRSYIVGGSDKLPKAMAAALNRKVRLNDPVMAIEQTANGVETRLNSGLRVDSQFVICAAPFSAVKNIRFDPVLPPKQAEATQNAFYSATTHFHFLIKHPYWEDDNLPPSMWSDQIFERGFVITNGGGEFGRLVIWLNGDGASALNHLSLEGQQAKILESLYLSRPSMKNALHPLVSNSWEQHPFIGGNKHVFGAGQVKSFAKEMGDPHGRVHFAGEHLRKVDLGMEAAMETSELAALNVLEKL